MNLQYLQQFTNSNLKKRLLHIDNIGPLEEILAQENGRFVKLKRIKNKVDFGRDFQPAGIQKFFPDLRRDIDEFLQVAKIREPSFSSFHLWDGTNKDILRWYLTGAGCMAGGLGIGALAHRYKFYVKNQGKAPSFLTRRAFLFGVIPMIPGAFYILKGAVHYRIRSRDAGYISSKEEISYPTKLGQVQTEMFIAHEYTHHLQKVVGFYYSSALDLGMALEGHARGVDKYIASLYVERFDNPAYQYHYLSLSVPELIDSYLWLCYSLGTKPSTTLVKDLRRFRASATEPPLHGPGHCLFQIYRQTRGDDIYRDIVHGNFVFP